MILLQKINRTAQNQDDFQEVVDEYCGTGTAITGDFYGFKSQWPREATSALARTTTLLQRAHLWNLTTIEKIGRQRTVLF